MKLSEQQEAESLAKWLQIRRFDFTHIPNETGHSPEAKRRAIRMKRAGTSAGFPDYLIFAQGKRIAIELKRNDKSAKATPKQKAWLMVLARFGFECAVCHGRDEAVEFIQSVLNDKSAKQENESGEVF
jgi:hypothetical protein